MRYTEQKYPLRGEGQGRGEYEFFIWGLGTPIFKRFGPYIFTIWIITILQYQPSICTQSYSVICPRSPLFNPRRDRYHPTGPQGRFGELVLMVFAGSWVCRRRLLVKLNYWEIFSKTWWWSLDFVFSLTFPNHTSPPVLDTLKVLPHRLGASILPPFPHLEWPQSSPQPNIRALQVQNIDHFGNFWG